MGTAWVLVSDGLSSVWDGQLAKAELIAQAD